MIIWLKALRKGVAMGVVLKLCSNVKQTFFLDCIFIEGKR